MDKSKKSYLKKLIKRSLLSLKNSDQSFKSIYDIIFSFSDEVYFESSEYGIIKKTTYKEVELKIENATNFISNSLENITKGSFIALKLDNCEGWVIAFWSILRSGFKPLLINTRMSDDFNEQLMHLLNVKAVVSNNQFKDFFFLNVNDLMYQNSKTIEPSWENEIALSTSGTTGTPKICVYDGHAIAEQILNSEYVLKENWTIASFDKKEFKHLAFLPFYHIFGLTALLLWFSFFGRTFVFLKDMSPQTIRNTCQRHNITIFFAIPLLWNMTVDSLLKEIEKKDEKTKRKFYKAIKFSNNLQSFLPYIGKKFAVKAFKEVRSQIFGEGLKFAITGGGYISEKTLSILNGIGYSLYNGYGMTEIGITSVELRLKAKYRNLGSIGRPFPSIKYKVNDDGELMVKGSSLHKGMYINGIYKPRENDSYYFTGDIVAVDNNGYYYIKGRKDDLIIDDSGELISPDYIESHFIISYIDSLCVLDATIDGIKTLTLVFKPHQKINELQRNKMLNELNKINAQLPDFMKIKCFRESFVELPQVMKGNVQRKVLRNTLEHNQNDFPIIDLSKNKVLDPEVLSDLEKKFADEICSIFADCFGIDKSLIKPDSNFLYDLKGSSMQYFEIVHLISEKYNIDFTFENGELAATPLDFAKLVLRKS